MGDTEMKMKCYAMLCVALGVIVLISASPVYGDYYMDLTGDNVNINSDSSWYSLGGTGDRRARIGGGTTGLTGYLNTTYTDGAGRPQIAEYWDIADGHLDLQNGATLTKSGNDLKLAHPSDETAATVTLNPGASFHQTTGNDSFGLFIGYNNTRGTFVVNNGGTFGSTTDVALGGDVAGNNGNTSNSVGVFKVIGDGGDIDCNYFRVSRYSKVVFELDDTGVSTIDATGQLRIWDDGGSPAGNLIVDTSGYNGQHTVDLFTYGSLSGTFGTVQILGSELTEGNGTDPMTYSLDYSGGDITLVFNNVPEPSAFTLAAFGLLGLLGWRQRRRR